MRDSALKLLQPARYVHRNLDVGEELMRDSALKLTSQHYFKGSVVPSEKSSCATAL